MFDDLKHGKLENEGITPVPPLSSTNLQTNHQTGGTLRPIKDIRANNEIDNNVTSIVSALLSAVLALVVLMLAIFIVQALRRRRRERQGNLLNQPVIHTIASPAFAPITAAYTSRSGLASSRFLSWENVAHSSAPVPRSVDADTNENSSPENHMDQHPHQQQHHPPQLQQEQQQMANPTDLCLGAPSASSSASTSSSSSSSSAASSSNMLSTSFSCL